MNILGGLNTESVKFQIREVQHIVGDALEGRGVTGLAVGPTDALVLVNWRTRTITTVTPAGHLVGQFTEPKLEEPTVVCVDNEGRILVADNASSPRITVFSSQGQVLHRWGESGNKDGQLGAVTAIVAAPEGEIIVADSRVQVFGGESWEYIRTIGKTDSGEYFVYI